MLSYFGRQVINHLSTTSINAKSWLGGLYYPDQLYNFARIPDTLLGFFGCNKSRETSLPQDVVPTNITPKKVILLFIDAFGLRFFNQFKDELPFLRRFVASGVVSGISAQFPSTTAAHVTTIHFCQSVAQSGVYEWYYYEPKVGAVIAPLLYSIAGIDTPGLLLDMGYPQHSLLPSQTIYQRLSDLGVRSYVVQAGHLTASAYSKQALQGANICPYTSLDDGIAKLLKSVRQEEQASYHFMYIDSIDSVCHRQGPGSVKLENEIRKVFLALEEKLMAGLAGVKDCMLLVTADHGQVETVPENTFYVNREIEGICSKLKTNPKGEPILFSGSARDLFLHVKDECLESLGDELANRLNGRAAVIKVAENMARLFGPGPYSAEFLSRLGNLLILPYKNESVFWYEAGKFEMKFKGHHGGLTAEELQSVLLALPID